MRARHHASDRGDGSRNGGGDGSHFATRTAGPSAADLVEAAATGDREAWEALVRRHVGLLWHIALRHGLSEADAADVVQNTWLRLCEHIDDVRDPGRVAAWLSTTAQRESLRAVVSRQRVVPVEDLAVDEPDRLAAPVDEGLIAREQVASVRSALDTLPATWRALLELLAQDPAPSYQQVGARLGLPVGSIGPTRGRSMRRLRTILPA